MELLKNVLIKEVDGRKDGDKVFIVDNLPKSLLYRKALKQMVDYTNPNQPLVAAFEIDERGRKIPTGEMVDELLPGIELSQTGDGGYCFFTQYNEARMRLEDIDRHIQASMPMTDRIARRVSYAIQPGVMTSSTKPLHELPRVTLPELVSPPSKDVQADAVSTGVLTQPTVKHAMTEEQKAAARARMARAREIKKAKQTPQ